jgi:hypothetical protein
VSLSSDQLWLLSTAAETHLGLAWQQLAENQNILKIVQRLRKTLSPTQAALTMELAQLRLRAKDKFGLAEQMFLTTRGYEQSTSDLLAAYKAQLLPPGQRLLDLCCGIGGDLSGFARTHEATGIDLDPLLCEYARRNAALRSTTPVQVQCQSAVEVSWAGYDFIHVDPDRRSEQHRTTDCRFIQPPLSQLLAKAGEIPLVIKLAPATRLPDELKPLAHRQWLGEHRECKQQLVWLNTRGRQPLGRKSATLVLKDGTSVTVTQTRFDGAVALRHLNAPPEPGSVILEPHAVVLAARLVDSLAADFGLKRVTPGLAYLSGEHPVDSPLLSSFRILSVCPAETRQVTGELRALGAGVMEWKKRGVELQLFEELQRIRTKGDRPLVALLLPHEERNLCLIAERIARQPRPNSNPAIGG